MLHVPDSLYQPIEVTPEGFFSSLAKILQSKIGCDRVSLTIYESATDSLAWFAKAAGICVTCMDSGAALGLICGEIGTNNSVFKIAQ